MALTSVGFTRPRTAMVCAVGVVTLAVGFAACGSGPARKTAASSGPPSNATGQTPTSGTGTFDVTLTGALQGPLHSGPSTGMMCNVAAISTQAVSIGMYGTFNGTIYSLAVNQGRLSPGIYSYPAPTGSPPPPTLPFVQLVSPTSSAAWTAFQGVGKGSVTIVGGKDA